MIDKTPSEDELLAALKDLQFPNPIMNPASAIISLGKYHDWPLDENTIRVVIQKYTITDWSPEPEREEDQTLEEISDICLRINGPSSQQSDSWKEIEEHSHKSRELEKEAEEVSDSHLPRISQSCSSQRKDTREEDKDETYWSSLEIPRDDADWSWEPEGMFQSLGQTLQNAKEEEYWANVQQRKLKPGAIPGQHELIIAIKNLRLRSPGLRGSEAHCCICEQYNWKISKKRFQDNDYIVNRLNWLRKLTDHEETPTATIDKTDKRHLNEDELLTVITKLRSKLPTIQKCETLLYLWFWDNVLVSSTQYDDIVGKLDRANKPVVTEEAPMVLKNVNRLDHPNENIRNKNPPAISVNMQQPNEVDKIVKRTKVPINTDYKPNQVSPNRDLLITAITKLRTEQPMMRGKIARQYLQKKHNWCFSIKIYESIVGELDLAERRCNEKEPAPEEVLIAFRTLKDQHPYWNKEKLFDFLRSENAWILSFMRFRAIVGGASLSGRSQSTVEETQKQHLEETQAGSHAEKLASKEEAPKTLEFEPNKVKLQQAESPLSAKMLHARPLSSNEKTLLNILNQAGTEQRLAENQNWTGTATPEAIKDPSQIRGKTALTELGAKETTQMLYQADDAPPVAQEEVAHSLEKSAVAPPEGQAKEMKMSLGSMVNNVCYEEVVDPELQSPYPTLKRGRSRLPQPITKNPGSTPRSSNTINTRGKRRSLLRRALTNSVVEMEVTGDAVKAANNTYQILDASKSSNLEIKTMQLSKEAELEDMAMTKTMQWSESFEIKGKGPQAPSVNEFAKPDRDIKLISESSQPLLMGRNGSHPSRPEDCTEVEKTAEKEPSSAQWDLEKLNAKDGRFVKLRGKEFDFSVQPKSEMSELLEKQYKFVKEHLIPYEGESMPEWRRDVLASSEDLQGLWKFYKLSGEKLQIGKEDMAAQFHDKWKVDPVKGEGDNDNNDELARLKEEYKKRKIDELRREEALHPNTIVFHVDEIGSWSPKFDEEKIGLTSIKAWKYEKDGRNIGRVL